MQPSHEMRIRPSQLSSRVLLRDPSRLSAQQAARAVELFLVRKHAALAQALQVTAQGGEVLLRAFGPAAEEFLHEAEELLRPDTERAPEAEIEVDPKEFAVHVSALPAEAEPETGRELLHSQVRYFPYPTCEWSDLSAGDLILSDRRLVYEPEWVIAGDEGPSYGKRGYHDIALADMRAAYRGEWWDVPCVMVEAGATVYRYGWPAERGEASTVLNVGEWVRGLRALLEDG